ncbi:hypothetical protein TraAM80_03986 [Trypanosoma rangeli]|uniref:Uncharacterized protein n=1 Tax=Trypanosoma rangeli TaxID=5698 RepID=A0A3R7L2J3_TRYRA|nr:uncharacterized protein TraAM80_03986 [Trypanosoma rangeli]RNF06296.1 hypothetical protein TraAM80_03986 [Trypanosoma rangeli]|eukprot:RNF06296.1 hypothetical protein TraAM80_03986 [Trypanosoma rangeli]
MLRSTHLWLHGSAARSQSVLTALLRIRHQYQRPTNPLNRRDASMQLMSTSRDHFVSALQERQQLVGEAMKLLRKEVRGSDTLSDVDTESASFCIEVGKLLSVAAAFGATTTTPRVAEALRWVRMNKKQLVSLRQVMSICMPLLNLKDGKTAGRRFVVEELSTPLLTALETPVFATASLESDLKQHRSAVVSVFTLVGRVLDSDSGDADEARQAIGEDDLRRPSSMEDSLKLYQTALLFFTKGVDALLMMVKRQLPPLEIFECVHILQACGRLEADAEDDFAATVRDGLNKVRPMIDAALGPSTGTSKRPSDVCHLLSVTSKLQDAQHMRELSRAVLALLPLALASASVKDICVALQVLVRLRSSATEVTEESSMVRRVLEAVRPKLFLIAETHPGSLRHIECSSLMSTLSRLDEELADDLVNLLCGCFSASMEQVPPAQLIPFLQGLARCSEAASRSSGEAHHVPFWEVVRLPSVLPCIEQAADRVIAWAAAGTLTSMESAQLLLLFLRLRYPRVTAVYEALEPKLSVTVDCLSKGHSDDNNGTDGDATCSSGDGNAVGGNGLSQEFKQKALGDTDVILLTSALMNALNAYRNEAVTVTREEEVSLKRADKLCETLRQGAVGSIAQTDNPKSLVMLLHLLLSEGKKGGGGNASMKTAVTTASVTTRSPSRLLDAVAGQVCLVAPVTNAYEVGALAKAVGELMALELIGEAEAQRAMEAILERSGSVELNVYDAQSLLEGVRRVRAVSIPPSFLHHLATLLQTAPKKTTWILRRLLPVLKTATLKPTVLEALIKLTEVAMTNACTLMSTNASSLPPPPLRDIALLAHGLAQLYEFCSCLPNNVRHESFGAELTEELEEETEEEETNFLNDDTAADESDEFKQPLLIVTKQAFSILGDVACASLQQLGDSSDEPTFTQILPKEVVMLVQSFEKVGVRHHTFLYEVVPFVRDMSSAMEPLEISLLLNAFARLGAWNGRVLNTLASNVAKQVSTCSLKQCQSILKALQLSGFLSPDVLFSTTAYKTSLEQDWRHACAPVTQASINPLVLLSISVVERMTTLIEQSESVPAVLETQSLEDIAAVVRVLFFFDQPPQPAFDTYFEMAVKLLLARKRILDDGSPRKQRNWLMIALALNGCVGKLRRYQRQCISAQAIAYAVTSHQTALVSLSPGLRLMPEEKVAELYCACCACALVYHGKFSPEEAAPFLEVISEKLRDEDVARNPRRVSSALRHLTKISCRHIGAPCVVYRNALDSARRLAALLQGTVVEERSENASLCSSSAAAVVMEVLSMSHLLALPYSMGETQELSQLLSFFADQIRRNGVSTLSAAEGSVLVLATVIGTTTTTPCPVNVAWLDEVQHGILLKKQMSVHDAVNILLAGALCRNERIVRAETVQLASRVLVSQMGKTDSTGLWLLPNLYRLTTAGDACFMAWCTRLQEAAADGASASVAGGVLEVFERVLPALLRAMRSASKDVTPTLCWKCRADVVEQYRRHSLKRGEDAGLTEVFAELLEEQELCVSPHSTN